MSRKPIPDEKRPWAVFVSGSRNLTWGHMDLVVEKLTPFSTPRQSLLIHGAGEGGNATIPGCDRVAAEAARHLKMVVFGFPALWNLFDTAAGPIRNRLCAEVLFAHGAAGYRLAFLAFSSGGAGTSSAIREVKNVQARDAGKLQPLALHTEIIDVTL